MHMHPYRPPLHAYLALATSMALVGSYVALSKPLLGAFPVFVLAWLRFAIGAVAMAPWLRKPVGEPAMSRRTHARLFAQSWFGNFWFSICMLFGVKHTPASQAGVIMAALPAVVALFSAWLLRERLQARAVLAIGLAVAGIMLYAGSTPDGRSGQGCWGPLLIAAAVCCEALYVVIGKSLSAELSAKRVSALINLWGLALMTPLAIWEWVHTSIARPSLPMLALLLFYGLAASVWTVWLWMHGLRHVDAHRAGVFTVMLPVSAAAFGVWVLSETLSPVQMLAFGLALAGVWMVTWPSRRDLAKQA